MKAAPVALINVNYGRRIRKLAGEAVHLLAGAYGLAGFGRIGHTQNIIRFWLCRLCFERGKMTKLSVIARRVAPWQSRVTSAGFRVWLLDRRASLAMTMRVGIIICSPSPAFALRATAPHPGPLPLGEGRGEGVWRPGFIWRACRRAPPHPGLLPQGEKVRRHTMLYFARISLS